MAIMQRVAPHIVVPGILAPQTQSVDFEKYVGHKSNLAGMAEERIYITTIENINSETSIGQQWASELTKQSYSLGQVGLNYYRINAYIEYDENEQAKFEALSNGVGLVPFLENLAKQGINQRRHQAILFGFDDALNQGIAANTTLVTMPQDSKNVKTLTGYQIAELQIWLTKLVRDAMDKSFNMIKPVVFASSVRVINYLKSAMIPTGQYLQSGSVASVSQVFDRVVSEWLGCPNIEFVADDLLRGKTEADDDTILIIAPGMNTEGLAPEDISQNLVGEFNSITYNTMYDAAEGLKEYTRPDDFGRYSKLLTFKMTPGATLRSEAVIECKVKYA